MTDAATDKHSLLSVILEGHDLGKLTPQAKVAYYEAVCEGCGLNPLTQPFEYIVLNGKLRLYAKRDATDMLRKVHLISITISDRSFIEGIYVVTARATMPNGRFDESTGAVALLTPKTYKNSKGEIIKHPRAGEPLDGEDRANGLMKAETKAKRRVTLSIVGLGVLDESEIDDIPTGEVSQTQGPVVEGLTAKVPTQTPAAQETGRTGEQDVTGTKTAPPAAVGATETAAAHSADNEHGGEGKSTPSSPGDASSKAASAAVTETGEIMPANRVKRMRVLMNLSNVTDEDFIKKFGKKVEECLVSQSQEIDAFLKGAEKK